MIEQIKNITDLTLIHWFLAYATLASRLFLDLAVSTGTLKETIFNKKTFFTTLAHGMLIPVCLITCTDTAIKTILPINYVTAVLLGFNIEMFVNIIVKVGESRIKKIKDENS